MGRCIALLIAAAVPWLAAFAMWIIVALMLASVVAGPVGWAIVFAIAFTLIGIGLLWWAFKVCGG